MNSTYEVGRPLGSRPGRAGAAPLQPVLQPFEGEPALLPHDQLAVYAGYHSCLINRPYPSTDQRCEWFRGGVQGGGDLPGAAPVR